MFLLSKNFPVFVYGRIPVNLNTTTIYTRSWIDILVIIIRSRRTHFLFIHNSTTCIRSSVNNLLLYIFSLKQSSHIQNFDCLSMPSFTIAILLAVLLHLILLSVEFLHLISCSFSYRHFLLFFSNMTY